MRPVKPCPVCGGAVAWCSHGEHSCHYIECGFCGASFNLERCVHEDLLSGALEPLQEAIAWVWNGQRAAVGATADSDA